MKLSLSATFSLVFSLGWVAPCLAQTGEDPTHVAARALGYAGIDAYDAGDYETAVQRLEEAYAALRVPSLGLWSARALLKRGNWVAAEQRLREVTQLSIEAGEPAIQRQARLEALQDLTELEPKLPRLIVQLQNAEPAEVTIELDGAPLELSRWSKPFAVNPGERHVVAARGGRTVEAVVNVSEGEQKTATLRFAETAVPSTPLSPSTLSPSAQSPSAQSQPADPLAESQSEFVSDVLPWVLVGTGAASLVVGGITLGMALGEAEAIDDNPNCVQRACLSSERRSVDRFNTLNTVSGVTLIGGGVLAAAGLTLWLVESEPQDIAGRQRHRGSLEVAFRASPTTLWLTGAF